MWIKIGLIIAILAGVIWLIPPNGQPQAPTVSTADRIRAICRVEASPSKRDQEDCYTKRIIALAAGLHAADFERRMREAGR